MNLQATYDREVDVLRLFTGEKGATSTTLHEQDSLVLDLAARDGHYIVGIEVIGASSYLPLGKRGYDVKTDTLTLGTINGSSLVAENGDIVSYWQGYEDALDSIRVPIGVAIQRASKHLAGILSGPSGSNQRGQSPIV